MKKNILLTLVSQFLFVALWSQQYGNEWINYTQPYLKFKIVQDGVYRINYNSLQAGLNQLNPQININNINPKNIQVFGRGKEVPIHIDGESDNSFDANDYVEFYAQKNDGWADSMLYRTSDQQTNPFYSLFTDTAYYYITLGSTLSNKRLENVTNTTFSGSPVSFFYDKETVSYTNSYYFGKEQGQQYIPYYTYGEGFMSSAMSVGGTQSITSSLSLQNIVSGTSNPIELSYLTVGVSPLNHNLIGTYGSNQITFLDTSFVGHKAIRKEYLINNYSDNQMDVTFQLVPALGNGSQRKTVAWVSAKYPHSFDLENKQTFKIELVNNGLNPYYLKAENFSGNTSSFVYDLTDGKRVKTVQSGNTIEAQIPASSNLSDNKICYFFTNNTIDQVTDLVPVTKSGFFTNYENLDPQNAFLLITHPSLRLASENYVAYKNTTTPTALLVIIDELYDQFSFGIKKHPLSIRNFTKFCWDTFTTKPKSLFLVGKAIMDDDQTYRNNQAIFNDHLIPSFSWPACDNSFTEGFNGTPDAPSIPTGRLAATTNEQVQDYLDKVIQYDQNLNAIQSTDIEDRLGIKRVLHFGGGTSVSEQVTFKNYLNNYQDIIESQNMGAKVFEFYKSTADPIEFNLADSIQDLVNSGVHFMSFFGHSSAGSFDINIDSPENYDNEGKYFFLLSNGCLSGDIHGKDGVSISEEYILAPQRGSVGFIAQTYLGIIGSLNQFSTKFYENLSVDDYNKSIGEAITNALQEMVNNNPSFSNIATALETTLHGDPSLKFSNTPKPDYAIISPPQLSFSPQEITTAIDSFEVNVLVSNQGKMDTSQFVVELTRNFPGGSDTVYTQFVSPVAYQKLVTFKLPVDVQNGIGLNTFSVSVDPSNLIDEHLEINNNINSTVAEATLFINSNDLIPVYPYNYAVIDELPVTLKASTSSPVLSEQQYIIQLDTTDTYSSSVMKQTIVSQLGGVVNWNPTFDVQTDSVVYFWRASPYFTNPDSLKWREHSFQYINNQRGWGQDHFHQFKNNSYSRLNYDRFERELRFDTTTASISCRNRIANNSFELDGVRFDVNGVEYGRNNCNLQPVFFVVVVDPQTLLPWEAAYITNTGDTINYPEFDFGNGNNLLEPNPNNCKNPNSANPEPSFRLRHYFSFLTTDQEQMDSLSSMLTNKIPDGHYVMVYTGGAQINFNSNPIISSSGVEQVFANMGSGAIDTLTDGTPWIFFAQKGDATTAKETVPQNSNSEIITLTANMKGADDQGSLSTDLIGPAFEWNELSWNFTNTELNNADSIQLQVLSPEGAELAGFNTLSGSISNLGNLVNVNEYPYIRLKATLGDEVTQYPAQNKYWRILYSEAPEAAIDQNTAYLLQSDSVFEGQTVKFAIAINNIGSVNMDSLLVNYQVINSNEVSEITYPKQDSLLIGETLLDTISISTFGKSGWNNLNMTVNPLGDTWQPEQYHFNNILRVPFYVIGDKTNPILDVTFDGNHILDGDIVSPNPSILITLKDENLFLLLDEDEDTANFDVFLINPSGESSRVNFYEGGVQILNYEKATEQNPVFSIEYSPKLLEDGVYKLRVQATDKSGNKSGDLDYLISFEVINRSTITQVMNYPNPFSTRTKFIFTLTGSEIPDVFKIQILSVSGRIVREITKNELGELKIGRNITDFTWDGTDEFGDQLANGVYLYRVITKINNETIETRETASDQYFKKGFGKMYLMR